MPKPEVVWYADIEEGQMPFIKTMLHENKMDFWYEPAVAIGFIMVFGHPMLLHKNGLFYDCTEPITGARVVNKKTKHGFFSDKEEIMVYMKARLEQFGITQYEQFLEFIWTTERNVELTKVHSGQLPANLLTALM